MANPKQLEFLESLQGDHPDLAADIAELATLYQRKLWHQLTLRIESLYEQPSFNKGDLPIRLFQNFISDFAQKINLLKLGQFAVHVSKFFSSPAQTIEFLQSAIVKLEEMKLHKAKEPILFLKMHIAQHQVETSALPEAKTLVESGKDELSGMSDTDPSVSASVYYVASLYYKATGDFAEFYRSSLMYLSFVSSETLPQDFKLRLAVDVSLAALLGENIYSFGQLLQHPIVNVLDSSPHGWLHELLQAFNAGDMHKYDELCARHAAVLNAQPALVENERRLREKITLMCLMELISSLPAENRRIALDTIAARTKLNIDGVEFLLMRALALHLVEGSIDQVEGTVQISWVQPRVLTRPQIQGLKDRLDGWISKVQSIATTLEQETVGVVEA